MPKAAIIPAACQPGVWPIQSAAAAARAPQLHRCFRSDGIDGKIQDNIKVPSLQNNGASLTRPRAPAASLWLICFVLCFVLDEWL